MNDDRERLVATVYDIGLRIHREIGPGLLESVYEAVLTIRLEAIGLKVDRQKPVDIVVDGVRYPDAYRVDLFVEDWLVVELKALEKLSGVHIRQALTYIKLLNQPVGLLINFGEEYYKNGARRIINNHYR
jgi:GxxExxY protein